MIGETAILLRLRWLVVVLFGLLWTTIGGAASLAERDHFGPSSFAANSGLRGLGSRGVRNAEHLTDAQWSQIGGHIDELGLNGGDFLRSTHTSGYSDMLDKVFLGPNVFPAATGRVGGSVFERLTPRAVIAHEAGHLMTTRGGTAFAPGSLFDEVGASLAGRQLPGLSSTERYQLLRDAAERARAQGTTLRQLIGW
jgi:hypothetical protein